ncbi:MAG: D-amino-acid dehydrogenase, partial [Rhodothermales bacterium]
TSERSRLNTVAVLKLALESSKLLHNIRKKIPINFSFRQAGKLVMIDSQSSLVSARNSRLMKKEQGCETKILSLSEACEIEPGLRSFKHDYLGAVWSEHDEVGCPKMFCQALSQWLQENRSVEVRLNESIKSIETNNGKLVEIITSSGGIQPDAVVVCLGACSAEMLEPLGIRANIYPIRGYSVTLPLGAAPIETSVTDLGNKIVFSRLGDQIRIAGMADIVGFNSKHDPQRLKQLVEIAHSLAPEVADFNAKPDHGWGGYRPMTPDSRPLVGSTPVKGVFLNTGHGMLGWTLACATGNQVAKQLHSTI